MSNSLLLSVAPYVLVLVSLGTAIIGVVAGIWIETFFIAKKTSKNKAQALKIIEDAYAEAKTVKREALLEAKNEVQNLRLDFEKEQKEKKLEIQRSEDRILQREEFIDKKELALDKKSEALEQTKQELLDKQTDLEKLYEEQKEVKENMVKELEKVSGLK